MRVLHKGSPPVEKTDIVTCIHCRSELEVSRKDCDFGDEEWITNSYIPSDTLGKFSCPVCNRENYIDPCRFISPAKPPEDGIHSFTGEGYR